VDVVDGVDFVDPVPAPARVCAPRGCSGGAGGSLKAAGLGDGSFNERLGLTV